jgi:outer membrane protein OmpA-like peptidoglycan-associated protein
LIAQLRAKIGAPESTKLAIEDHRLVITGEAPWSWHARLSETLSDLPHPLTGYDVEELDIREWLEAQAVATKLNETAVYFQQDARLVENSRAVMDTVVQEALRLQSIDREMGIGLQIALIGFSDNTGKAQHNLRLRSERARRVRERMLAAGIDKKYLTIVVSEQRSTSDQIDEKWRRVAFAVSLEQPMAPSEER